MKKYSVRIELEMEADSNNEAQRITEIFAKELPRMENVCVKKCSLYNYNEKKVVCENIR
jgi:hypothetical protein